MLPSDAQGRQDRQTKVSRRGFLFTTTLAAASASLPAGAQEPAAPASRPLFAYAGSYSSPQGPEGGQGHGRHLPL